MVHGPRRHNFLYKHRLPLVKAGNSTYSIFQGNSVWKWGSKPAIWIVFLDLNDPSNFPLLTPGNVSICASDPVQCSSPDPMSFCVHISWSTQTISRHVPLFLPLSACWLSSPPSTDILQNIKVNEIEKTSALMSFDILFT